VSKKKSRILVLEELLGTSSTGWLALLAAGWYKKSGGVYGL